MADREVKRLSYDERQTELCNRLRERLQSIAILAVQAQDMDPSGDQLTDQLGTIEDDVLAAMRLNEKLQSNDI